MFFCIVSAYIILYCFTINCGIKVQCVLLLILCFKFLYCNHSLKKIKVLFFFFFIFFDWIKFCFFITGYFVFKKMNIIGSSLAHIFISFNINLQLAVSSIFNPTSFGKLYNRATCISACMSGSSLLVFCKNMYFLS